MLSKLQLRIRSRKSAGKHVERGSRSKRRGFDSMSAVASYGYADCRPVVSEYQLTSKLSVAGGYALDDTFDEDLSQGFRSKNDAFQGNVFYAFNPRLQVGPEVSRWHTRWWDCPTEK
jgi:hypothetical protein